MRRTVGSLVGLLLVAGCAGTGSPTTTPTTNSAPPTASATASAGATTPSPSASTPAETSKTVTITLAGGKADPNGDRLEVAKGTTLVLEITADHADEVHVHGYDIEIPVTAGKPVTKKILLDQAGRFEIEAHEPELVILQLIVS